ncbi:MAG TPA: FkbM family methyltransferase [Solirubrobacterales bacterium]|nr:FkbM family methyltransferase [Solirubrobacterales bacterium]
MSVLGRARNRARRGAGRLALEALRRRAQGDLYVDYGWGSLIYSGDGDAQEVLYHLHQREWYRQDMAVLRPLVAAGMTVVDVGANLGFFSLMVAPLLRPGGTIVALEPSRRTFAKLTRTIARNDLGDVVTAVNSGCAAAAGSATLHQVSASSGNATILAEGGRGGGGEEIGLTRLDDLDLDAVGLLKIDTEGYESEVLKGGTRMLAESRPTLFIELGGHYLEGTLEAVELLTELGYETAALRGVDWKGVGNGANFVVTPRA